MDFASCQSSVQTIRTAVRTVMVGQKHTLDLLPAALISGGHVLL